MSASDLPEGLLRFLQACIPTFPAAELLLFLAARPGEQFVPVRIVEAMKPAVITLPAVSEYLTLFREKGLLSGDFETGFTFAPSTPALQSAVKTLADAYNEKPVTLIRTIYMLAENKIQSFADSFRLKKE